MTNSKAKIKWPELTSGVLLKRYKRFLADVCLDGADGEGKGAEVTAYCSNTGTMKTCSDPGQRVWMSMSDNMKRKHRRTWEMIEMPGSLVGVNTGIPNKLVRITVEAGEIDELSGYEVVRPEVKVGNSRIDLLLTGSDKKDCYVEIKNCTLVEGRVAMFPDAVTTRGQKHIIELESQVKKGNRGVMFYLIQRVDADEFQPADLIDPKYGKLLRKACKNGVEILAYDVDIDLESIRIRNRVPVRL